MLACVGEEEPGRIGRPANHPTARGLSEREAQLDASELACGVGAESDEIVSIVGLGFGQEEPGSGQDSERRASDGGKGDRAQGGVGDEPDGATPDGGFEGRPQAHFELF